MNSSNPALSSQTFAGYEQVYGAGRSTAMTVQGTVNKTFFLLFILTSAAVWSWTAVSHDQLQPAVLPAALIGGLILSLVTIFKPSLAPWTAPVYAAFEGVFLGMLSYLIETGLGRRQYPGIALQAVSMTCGTLFCMLFAYRSGLIRVTEKLKAGIIAATGALCVVYLVSIVLRMVGYNVPFLNQANGIGIAFSVFVVGLAAFNLLLDFDSIDTGARVEAPKFMEWYCAFALMVTLVWLYLEVLRLLQKLQSRR